ncbi:MULTISPECIES: helix-turn-helix domain-containing protein [unclassified Microbacterium]|uniref:helix-turn-helix domain-containing protein n=1 Tax=unclassified Microbacterium TaxID=2609290 RepID=UPI003138EA6B
MAADELGTRLRQARQSRSLSLRSVAQSLGVSPSLISQVETGKSQPSVSTLYALANLLEVSADDLLGMGSDHSRGSSAAVARSDVQRAGDGPVIEMENGVRWERLAMSQGGAVEALLITYDPGASSSVDGRLMRHAGIEYGYMLEGVLTLQLDFDTYELSPGDSLHFESSRPHLLANRGAVPARGVWFVIGRHDTPNV